MRRLIYISQSLVGADPDAINAIVERSAIRNAQVGVTGMLWYDGIHFVQTLEGADRDVAETIARISSDSRHANAEVIFDRAVSSRVFGEWAMIRPNGGPTGTDSTAFLIGLAAGQRTPTARRVIDVAIEAAG